MNIKQMSQKDLVWRHILLFGSITSWEAIKEYGATRLSAIIFTLDKEGKKTESVRESSVNRFGNPVSYVRYKKVKKDNLIEMMEANE